LDASLHKAGPERCEKTRVLWPQSQGASALGNTRKRPLAKSPPFEKLVGDLSGAYSRRINIQHRLVYQVLEAEKAVKILRLWTHYE
jgi:Txe/YoeB family toxin of toxin-antitoxin system